MVTKSDFKNGNVNQASFVQLNPDLMTDGGYGESRRVRVDVGQTGFFAGREFRTFKARWEERLT